jgi:catechol 2,3-dioxygenase
MGKRQKSRMNLPKLVRPHLVGRLHCSYSRVGIKERVRKHSEVAMTNLGHVVYFVRDFEHSVKFHTEAVGLDLCGSIFNGRAALLSGGNTHHELLLIQTSNAEGPLQGKRIGLYHVGWKIGDSIEELSACYHRLSKLGYAVDALSDHTISQSIYLRDPDGNEVEMYVDNPDYDWRNDDSWMEAPVKPLKINH